MYYPVVAFDETRGDGRFLAVSDAGNIYLSDDNGATFGSNVAPSSKTWNWSVWTGQNYCVVTDSTRKLIYSTSGEAGTWTEIDMPNLITLGLDGVAGNWKRIWRASDSSQIIAVSGLDGGGPTYIAVSSNHGLTWTVKNRVDPNPSGAITGVGCDYDGNGTYVVVGGPTPVENPRIRYSTNGGTSWATGSGLATSVQWKVVRYVPWLELWVAGGLGTSGAECAAWATNPASWTMTDDDTSMNDLIVMDDMLVGMGDSAHAYVSTDGKNWAAHLITALAQGYEGVAANGDGWYAYSYANNSKSAFAADPTSTWTDYGANQPNGNFNHVCSRFI